MFKQFVTLIRGTAHERSEAVMAPHGQTILRQQIRDCAQALASARYALAVAEAQHKMEVQQFERILARLADLETRTIEALNQGKEALATEAAESIALLESERDVSLKAQDSFTREIARLKTVIRNAGHRLKELEHGEKLTAATAKAQRLRERGQGSAFSTFKEAEETLARLRTRQTQFDSPWMPSTNWRWRTTPPPSPNGWLPMVAAPPSKPRPRMCSSVLRPREATTLLEQNRT